MLHENGAQKGRMAMTEPPDSWIMRLQNPQCFPHPVDRIQLCETHISWVILTGIFAYKIKKPVHFSFIDFSTLGKRRWFCEEEVRLNRRLAPDMYLEVVPITGLPTTPQMDGRGRPFEYAVKMKQFSPQQDIHDIFAEKEKGMKVMTQLAETIATFHARIEKAGEDSPFGQPERVWPPVKESLEDIPRQMLPSSMQQYLTIINQWLQTEWQKLSSVFLHRKQGGFIRECHGDLHLGNLAIFEGNICVFDALEFEPSLRWIDVMSEMAFLVMDLQKHGYHDFAAVYLNRYLEITGDYEGLKVFRWYQVYRALVRTKVAGLRLNQLTEGEEEEKAKLELMEYIELAHCLIEPTSPVLGLMHGVSGTGKTTVSTEIVKTIGAIRVRSDVERKRLVAGTLTCREECSQGTDLYDATITERTYARLHNLARILIQAGFFVVVDATFLRHHQRELFRRLAEELDCGWLIVDVFAPQELLVERLERRFREGQDASDATVDIMEHQQETEEPIRSNEESYVISVDSTNQQTIVAAMKMIKKKLKI